MEKSGSKVRRRTVGRPARLVRRHCLMHARAVHGYVRRTLQGKLHAKRVDSMAAAVTGVIYAGKLGVDERDRSGACDCAPHASKARNQTD